MTPTDRPRGHRYIFVTGGVVSSLGKGVVSASLGSLLKSADRKITIIKLDPYINVDPGTMNPFEHGEVFVTADGAETDLDLGHYERFTGIETGSGNNITTGSIYKHVIEKEREGAFLGQTVQVIPHITNEICRRVEEIASQFDITIVEVGGTVGDIESLPFLEAVRQLRLAHERHETASIHVSLAPRLAATGEIKTKPTQHSVRTLASLGINPDFIVCRSVEPLTESISDKIANFCNVKRQHVFSSYNVPSIYEVPIVLSEQGIVESVTQHLRIDAQEPNTGIWQNLMARRAQAVQSSPIRVAFIGKYIHNLDAYASLVQSLHHSGWAEGVDIQVEQHDGESVETEETRRAIEEADAVMVPGGFGKRGSQGMIQAIQIAREQRKPYLGICYGMHLAAVEVARNVGGLHDASSTEIERETAVPLVSLVEEWESADGSKRVGETARRGATMRLGAYPTNLQPGTKIAESYGDVAIVERHRHRYEFNPKYEGALAKAGLVLSGRSPDGIVEAIELKDHPFFVGVQFHPEFKSTPDAGHPLIRAFIRAARQESEA